MAVVQTNDAKKLSRDKHGSYSRLMRVTMKDGSTEEFLMESVKNLTFAANPNDSSDIDEKPPVEDPELPDVPDRTPEARSMSSTATSSSSSDWYGPEVKSSESKSSDSKSSDKSSSSFVEESSSSAKSSDSKSSDDKSSDSKPVDKSSDSKSSDKSSSSSIEQSSSSAKSSESKSSESKSSDSKPADKSSDSKSSDSKQSDDKSSSSSAKPSSSSAKQSSSSEATTGLPNIDYAGTRIMWTPKKQTLSVFSRQAGNAKFTLFDAQGVTVGSGSMYVTRGSTSLSLEYLNLPKGTFVIRFEIGNTKLQQKISVTGK
jgi:hypothetical protein